MTLKPTGIGGITMTGAHQTNSVAPETENSNDIHADALALAQLIYDIYKEKQRTNDDDN